VSKIRCLDIEIAVSEHFNPRLNIMVPNVSWGFGLHECDMLVLTKSGHATEVEIKVSAADLKKDAKKWHGHASDKIEFLYFAVPETLLKYEAFIPSWAGILVVSEAEEIRYTSSYSSGEPRRICRVHRLPQRRLTYKFSENEMYRIARLGTMRIWTLKQKIKKMRDQQEATK